MLNHEQIYPLTHSQKRIWFTEEFFPNTSISNIGGLIRLQAEKLDYALLQKAIQTFIQMNDSIRLRIMVDSQTNEPRQYIAPYRKEALPIIDFSDKTTEDELYSWANERFAIPFELINKQLFECSVIKCNEQEGYIYLKTHHIITDGMAYVHIVNHIISIYTELLAGTDVLNSQNMHIPASFIDFIHDEEKYISSVRFQKDREFWHEEFATLPEFTGFKAYDAYSVSTKAKRKRIIVPQELRDQAQQFCAENNISIFTLFMSMFHAYVYRLTGQTDITIGTTCNNRTQRKEKDMVGMLVSTMPFRFQGNPAQDVLTFIRDVAKKQNKLFRHQKYPYDQVMQKVRDKHPHVNSLFRLFAGYQILDFEQIAGVCYTVEQLFVGHMTEEIALHIQEHKDKDLLTIEIDYVAEMYTEDEINRLADHLLRITQDSISFPEKKIAELEMLSEREKHNLIALSNQTVKPFPQEKTIHQLFEEQVAMNPEQIAVYFEGSRLTYQELNEKANQLSHCLRDMGVTTDQLVAILADRSVEMIVSMLAILKAGGAYVAIDPVHPSERISYMLQDSEANILLAQQQFVKDISFDGHILELEDEKLFVGDTANPTWSVQATDLAYVIYTSGTTGKPKGVMVEHRGIINLQQFLSTQYGLCKQDRVVQYASSSFDVSVKEIFMCLLHGATLYIPTKETTQDPALYESYLSNHQITVAVLPPVFAVHVNADKLRSLRLLFTGGSATTLEMVRTWKDRVMYVNAYGPTEASVQATAWLAEEREDGMISIGKPIDNVQVYVLNSEYQLQPVGVAGELCIGGVGLARGYLNRPELTQEKFIAHPFKTGEKIYRTGDLVRWMPDGNIEYLGRMDDQVKIRGYRIELLEIEAQMLEIEEVVQTTVIPFTNDNGQTDLCAYFVATREMSVLELRQSIGKNLPAYMIPSTFMQLDEMPLTVNGKIDKKALPKPEGTLHTGLPYVAPRNEVEELLASAWEKVLGVERISIMDNFFEIGGDSIKAIQISARLHKDGLKVEMRDIFKHLSIAELSKYVKVVKNSYDQGMVVGDIPLTPIQHWFFQNQRNNRHHFNQANMLYRAEGFDAEIIRQVFERIIEHHDALRMTYSTLENESIQQVNQAFTTDRFDFEIIDLTDETNESVIKDQMKQHADRLQTSIDLENQGPLVKIGLFKTTSGDHLLIVIHHLVIDGVSWRILLEDLSTGYSQAARGEALLLPAKTVSFKEWSNQLQSYAASKAFLKEKPYWRQLEQTTIQPLPTDGPITNNLKMDSSDIHIELTPQQTKQLLKDVHHAYHTEINDLLLTALGLTVKNWTGEENVLLLLEGHGREDIMANMDVTRTIGWFTSAYPVLLPIKEDELSKQIKLTKEALRSIPNKGIGYGILQYITPKEHTESMSFTLQPQISFNYLGQFDQDTATDVFTSSQMSNGEAISPYFVRNQLLECNGGIFNGKLQMIFTYNHHAYHESTIQHIADQFKTNLLQLVDHCVIKTTSELTPSDVGAQNLSIEEFESIQAVLQEMIGQTSISKIYPLSPMQEGMLFHSELQPDSPAYFEQNSIPLHGTLDLALLEQSLNAVLARYDVLRTVFVHQELKHPVQVVLQERKTTIQFEDISHLDVANQQSYLNSYKEKDKQEGFAIHKDVLLRLTVLKTGEDTYQLLVSFHHIIMDGWCFVLVLDELIRTYHSLLNNTAIQLHAVYPYSDYIEWLEKQDREDALSYWKNELLGYEQLATLPKWRSQKTRNYVQANHLFHFDNETTLGLERLAKQHHTTLNNVFQSLWGILLGRYNGVDDVVFGAVVSGRNADIQGIEQIVGLFINTIPVRVQPFAELSFTELLQQVKERGTAASQFDYLSLAEIQAMSSLKQGLLDHLLVFENYPTPDKERASSHQQRLDFEFARMEVFEQTNYDFNVLVAPYDQLYVNFRYNEQIYAPQLVESIASHLTELARAVVSQPEMKLGNINILSEAEKHQILYEFNQTTADYPRHKTIHQLFEETVARIPDNTAVYFENEELTYRMLHERTNQLARTLRANGVTPNSIVGIMLDRSFEMIIGILGILKAGGAYLPLDPKHPQDRLEFTLEDSKAQILLTQSTYNGRVDFNGLVIEIDQPAAYHTDSTNLEHVNKATDLAYVIYTSGSTGKPKGAMIEHTSVLNRLLWMQKAYPLTENDVILQKTPFTFDVSVWEMFWWAFVGAKVCFLIPEGEKDSSTIVNAIEHRRVTTMHFVPSMLHAFLEHVHLHVAEIERLASLRTVFASGEALQVAHVERFQSLLHNAYQTKLVNLYGPTEATVDVSVFECSVEEERMDTVPIGKPIDNTQLYIVSKENQLQPVGVAGELCIGGVQVARGYLNRPELTIEKFVSNPYVNGERMYRTGDLARWMPDGNIEYLGRIDHQVKIRGFRIELGEIETQILAFGGIKETVVIASEDSQGEKYLCAYFVGTKEIDSAELRDFLANDLPSYFIPARFIQLEKMPLSPNGKIDRKALPKDEFIGKTTEYIAPRTKVEEKLVVIWQELLGISPIGIHDDFFELGGHSLKATILASRLHKECDVQIALRDLFQYKTIESLATLITNTQKTHYSEIQPVMPSQYYSVSSAQKRVLIIAQMQGAELAYNMPVVYKLSGYIDRDRLEEACKNLVQRHESLRTSFDWIDGEPVQIIHPSVDFNMSCKELSTDHSTHEKAIARAVQAFIRPFDLNQAPLFRVELVTIKEDEHILMIDMHHIISDGVSTNIILRELSKLYAGEQLPSQRIQYKDFAAWQQELYQTDRMQKQEAYWLKTFEGEIPTLQMPTDYARPSIQNFEGDILSFDIDADLTKSLHQITSQTGTTMYMVLLAAFQVLLAKYSGQEEIIVGSPVAGRQHADVEETVGMFVGTLALRGFPAFEKTFTSYLKEVKESTLQAFENQDYPFEELVEKLNVNRDMSRNPLFDVMFALQNVGNEMLKIDGVATTPYEAIFNLAKFDITLAAFEVGEEINCYVNYSTKLFRKDTIDRLAGHFVQVLRSIVNNLDIQISQIDMVTPAEKEQLLFTFNDTDREFDTQVTIQQLFDKQAALSPEQVAVYFEGKPLTYQELNEKANQLARLLMSKGVAKDKIVAIMTNRSIEMIVSIIAVLKAGGAYVPIDPVYPADRIQYMLEDSNAKVLLTQKHLMDKVPFDGSILDIDDEKLYQGEVANVDIQASPTDLAYVIYTSGTTGKPKGVMVEHHGIISLKTYYQSDFDIGIGDRMVQFASSSFDVSIWEIMISLLTGATLYIPTQDTIYDPVAFGDYIEAHQITIGLLPPVYIGNVEPNKLSAMRLLLTGGSASNNEIVATWKNRTTYMNAYGPTESSVIATTWIGTDREDEALPIGSPIPNTKAYVLNKQNQLQPIGVLGELCISGAGLARGYLNKPELTEKVFVEHPFAEGERMYKTGDLVRWLPDGMIEYFGRIDDQVKIRGYRIELGEIEAHLLSLDEIHAAVVIAFTNEEGQPDLCAYIVADHEINIADIRQQIGQHLPSYMIPAYFVQLESIPVSVNGKVDKKRLPKPATSNSTGREYVAPRNEIEATLASIWQAVLGVEQISIHDNFFEIGGDSIKAIQISSRLHKEGQRLVISDLFKNPTIAQLSSYVKAGTQAFDQGSVEGNVPLTPIQRWLFTEHSASLHHFNQANFLYRPEGFNVEHVHQVFTQIVHHHDALRMAYSFTPNDMAKQVNRGINETEASFTIEVIDLLEESNEEQVAVRIEQEANRIQSSMGLLHQGPLVKLGLFKTTEGDHLLIAIHHLVIDGVSWRILLEDFTTGYEQAQNGEPIVFPAKTVSLQEWAKRLEDYSTSKELLREKSYWDQLEQTSIDPIPTDFITSHNRMKDSSTLSMELSETDTALLLTDVHRAYRTEMNDILLTALGITLKEWTSNNDIAILLEGHGREDIMEEIDINRTIGWFTSAFPVLLPMSKVSDISYGIKQVKETLRKIPNKGIGYGILKYLTPEDQKLDMSFTIQPEISFNYLGQFDQEVTTAVFTISNMSRGCLVNPEMNREQLIDITGATVGGKLQLSFVYNHLAFQKESIEKLIEVFTSNLLLIITHCTSQSTPELTPSDLGYAGLSIEEWDTIRTFVLSELETNEISKLYPLSPMQEGMLFHANLDTNTSMYVEQYSLPISGHMDLSKMEQAFNSIIQRYDVLRSIFVQKDLTRPLQVVLNERKATVHFEDISALAQEDRVNYTEDFKQQDKERGFKLSSDRLIRLAILQTAAEEYLMILSFHHILTDGWSIPIIMGEFIHTYHSLLNDLPLSLGPVYPYSDYINWLEKQDKAEAISYWKEYVAGYEQLATIPKERKVEAVEYKTELYEFCFDKAMTSGLEQIAKQYQTTLNSVFQTIWGILLARYNRTNDVVFGAVVSGRNANVTGIEQMVGLFINSIPVRIQLDAETQFTQVLQQVQEDALASADYDYLSLAEIQSTSELRQGLLDHLIAFENYPTPAEDTHIHLAKKIDIDFQQMEVHEQTNYDFNIAVGPGEKLYIKFMYNAHVYNKQMMEGIAANLQQIARSILADPSSKVSEIDIVSAEERQKLLVKFNHTQVPFEQDKTIPQIFEELVMKHPHHPAVYFEGDQLTYQELNDKANQLARELLALGIGTDQIVAVMADKSIEMIVAIMAVLKAGGAYVPIDPAYPGERIAYVLEDSQAKVLLTQSHLLESVHMDIATYQGKIVELSDDRLYQGDSTNLKLSITPADLAYVIYTSGTTGKPKGVMLEHHGVVKLKQHIFDHYGMYQEDRVLQYVSPSFDASVKEIFACLLHGATLYVPKKETTQDPALFEDYVNRHHITVAALPPVFLVHVNPDKITSLRLLFTGGSAITTDLVQAWKDRTVYVNAYGPTEASIQATGWVTEERADGLLPIGRPIDNTQIYIVGVDYQLQPIGIPGELCISGVGLARGYLNRPELTREKFVGNPFVPDEKMYRTGDLARWLPDGNIEYLGRVDDQVKVRGFRIELGEIEAHLLSHEDITEAVVLALTDERGQTDLCAYFVSTTSIAITQLRHYLEQSLPSYMIPAFFIKLEKMPVTLNGKIDKRSLPKPDKNVDTGSVYVAPRNEIESKLVSIWQEVLGVERISVLDDFFALGGHSLKATVLLSKIHKEFETEASLREIFKHTKLEEMATLISQGQKSAFEEIHPVEIAESYPVSSAQKRLLILTQLEGAELSYNMPIALRLSGDIEAARLESSFRELINRHESLRTSFDWTDGQMRQIVHESAMFHLVHTVGSEDECNQIVSTFTQPFDLNQAPLLRAHLVTYKDKEHLLLLDMHHSISDGVSMSIILTELAKIYAGEELPALSIQYKDFANWQQKMFTSDEMQKQEMYWLENLSGDLPVLQMPTDYPRPPVYSYDGDNVPFTVDKELSSALRQLAMETGTTMYMVLLAALQVTLAKYSGQNDILIGSPIAGRPHTDLQQIVGMFVGTLVMRGFPEAEKRFSSFLAEIKDTALHAYENQDYPFEVLIEKLDLKRDMSRNQLFDVMFTLQNMDGPESGLAFGEAKVSLYETKQNMATFDLTMTAHESEEGIGVDLNYCTKLFKRESMERFADHFTQVLRAISKSPDVILADIDMVTDREKHQLVTKFNDTNRDFRSDKTIHQLFEAQAELHPANSALYYEGQALTYQELNEKANQLARVLVAKGIKAEDNVAIMADRSLEMYIAILAVLKANGVYVPIDPAYPMERIRFILEDSQVQILLTHTTVDVQANISDSLEIISLHDQSLFQGEPQNLALPASPRNLAYIIYTSGTTGKPKGVMLEHRGVVNLLDHIQAEYGVSEQDRIIQYTSQSFDPSIMEIFLALHNGAQLYIPTKETTQDPALYETFINKHLITVAEIPGAFASVVNPERLISLRFVSTGGSALTPGVAKAWRDYVRFINAYGPTETTIQSTEWVVEERLDGALPIGRPVANTQIYILNQTNQLQPIGVPGELCIGGIGLARGYLNRPDLTAEKFITNPFVVGEKIYKTGDLARWLPDGNIEFLGRIDDQVKVRGFRIELLEVESHILELEDIVEAVVTVTQDLTGQNQLCAYFEAKRTITVSELREQLAKTLPAYMIPSYFIQLENMPLMVNGKIDKKALPAPEENMVIGNEYIAPQTEMEEKLAVIWEEVLGMKQISVESDFFELGGHSLKAVQLVSAISRDIGIEMPLQLVFRYRSIRPLAEKLTVVQYVQVDEEIPVTLLNEGGKPIVFAFPPIAGLGAAFKEIANELPDYSIYSFDFIAHDYLINEYVDHILNIQPEGPYLLMGYSAGGNLAFEVAKVLEEKGHHVQGIILLDTLRQTEYQLVNDEEIRENVALIDKAAEENEILKVASIRNKIVQNIENYGALLNTIINDGMVEASIHLILAKEIEREEELKWKESTMSTYMEYQGFSTHHEMVDKKYAKQHAYLIHEILELLLHQVKVSH
ncbi:non-ribosomal peptide synthase/polyketide synthase [Brevibacillus laterosporus]|uniref:NRPS domain-containing protein n=1 Tax=Brevibacillus laterosporus LMG 15441 TaxID=1042163 RepID=A0A075R4B4_BRELA|nr:non-ribosomal peptide synthetase [Brevibacillus laterosporus]AIG26684.1 NRPS domain-containing protein [Brevibacillus laterosporus LMG 15441]RJL14084.1 non-ribosomal peptide synthetase [Brevibacillus laterosporus]